VDFLVSPTGQARIIAVSPGGILVSEYHATGARWIDVLYLIAESL